MHFQYLGITNNAFKISFQRTKFTDYTNFLFRFNLINKRGLPLNSTKQLTNFLVGFLILCLVVHKVLKFLLDSTSIIPFWESFIFGLIAKRRKQKISWEICLEEQGNHKGRTKP